MLRLSTGRDGHFMSVLIGVFHALSSQRVAFGIQGLFGTGQTYCASAALILLTRMLGLKALFVAEPNLPFQNSREMCSPYSQMPRRRSVVSFRACLGGTMTKPLTLMSLMRPALNSSGTMSPAVLPLLHEIGRCGPLASFLQAIHLMFVDESQQAGQAAYVAVHGAVHCTALTVHIGDDRQTRGASSNDPIREEVLRRLCHKKVALHGLSDWSVPQDFLVLAAAQITGERSQEARPAALGMEYLAAAGRQPPSAAPMVFLVKDLPGSIWFCPVVCGFRLPPTS